MRGGCFLTLPIAVSYMKFIGYSFLYVSAFRSLNVCRKVFASTSPPFINSEALSSIVEEWEKMNVSLLSFPSLLPSIKDSLWERRNVAVPISEVENMFSVIHTSFQYKEFILFHAVL